VVHEVQAGPADKRTVKLVAFDPQHLRPGLPLPFALRDAAGRLLLAAGQKIEAADRLRSLREQALFSLENESADWHRRVVAAMDAQLRSGARLKDVVAATPDAMPDSTPRTELGLPEQWEEWALRLDTLLRSFANTHEAPERLRALARVARDCGARRLDGSLYVLVHQAGASTERYAAHHALLTMLVAEAAAAQLGVEPASVQALGLAALGMNVAMHKLQDQLAQTERELSPAMRAEIDLHAAASATLLGQAGLLDEAVLAIVREHHDRAAAGEDFTALPPTRQLARLLARVDAFAAKISRRASRAPMSPVRAAGEACLDPATGRPDAIGAALLKTVGLYPPGSFVELASGELGIVVARGRRANLPYVAALVSASGNVLAEPALRDTLDRRHAIKGAVAAERVRVRPPHEKLLALR
jgi:HD-GYP domain-containing protein (c-di-GMP phosphodiesterase class II)